MISRSRRTCGVALILLGLAAVANWFLSGPHVCMWGWWSDTGLCAIGIVCIACGRSCRRG